MSTDKQVVEAAFEYDAPAEAVWAILEDFGNVKRWWPAEGTAFPLDRVEIEGTGVGMVRKLYVAGSSRPTCERLDLLDATRRVLKLSIIGEAPAGLVSYQATGQVDRLPGDRCRFGYRGEYVTNAESPDQTRRFLLAAYSLLGDGIGQALGREQRGHLP